MRKEVDIVLAIDPGLREISKEGGSMYIKHFLSCSLVIFLSFVISEFLLDGCVLSTNGENHIDMGKTKQKLTVNNVQKIT